ncbi:hypothetical protein ACFLU6_09730 [Acidobacteriota bacterium]
MEAREAWKDDESMMFHYGFLSSRTSATLQGFLQNRKITQESKSLLKNASELLDDILIAQRLFGKEGYSAAPSEEELGAFGCALDVILAHRSEFNIKDIEDFAELFTTLHLTLQQLITSKNGRKPTRKDVRITRSFFSRLAELMLSQLAAPVEKEEKNF